MKCSVETLSPTRVRLAVELPFAELKPSFDAAYKKIGAQVRVPGFRPGKVPGRVLEQRIGRPAILEEVVQHAVPRAYDDAVRTNEVRVMGRPDIEVTKVEDGDLVSFTAEVDVRPDLELPDLAGLEVAVEDVTLTDEEVDEQVETLRQRFASLVTADRPTETGDTVTLDLATTVDGAPLADGAAEGLSHEVGSGQLIDGLDEAVVGLSAGESATFQTQLVAGEHGGQTADVQVTVRTVKAKQLDDLDDEFAQTVSEFDSLEELRADARERLRQVKVVQQGTEARNQLLTTLVETVEVPLPESVVDNEVHWREHRMNEQLEQGGLTMEGYLESLEQTQEEYSAELRTNAAKAVATQLILESYADQEQISVTEQDLTEHIVMQARRYRVPPEQFAQQLSESGQLASVMADVRRNKVLTVLLRAATITDGSGNPVDLSALLGPAAQADAETAADPLTAAADDAAGVPSDQR